MAVCARSLRVATITAAFLLREIVVGEATVVCVLHPPVAAAPLRALAEEAVAVVAEDADAKYNLL
jgi:hypothetical protein